MLKVVTAGQMREIDRITIKEIGIPGLRLMERAGEGVTRKAVEILGGVRGKRVLILCGRGNNGGDGFVIARLLHRLGARPHVFLLAKKEEVKGDALVNLHRAEELNIPIQIIIQEGDLAPALGWDLVIDALLGTGVKGAVAGLVGQAIQLINDFDAPVLSVDIPSGVEGDSGLCPEEGVRADFTVTMGLLKRGLLMNAGRERSGQVEVVDIGIPDNVIRRMGIGVNWVEWEDVAALLPRRSPTVNKGDCGKVLVLAGSVGMTGAAALCSEAVLRAGAGLAILGIPESLNLIMEVKLTEVMTKPLAETPAQTLSPKALNSIQELLDWADLLALGPGLTQHPETKKLVIRLLKKLSIPAVIDADGLNNLAGEEALLKNAKADLILTPHPGEFARLSGLTIADILKNRVERVKEKAQEWGCTIVLKGAPSVVGTPAGEIFINSTGNPGMATAGVGDVLTGTIAGLWVQGMTPGDAALAGIFLHGLAGDMARAEKGELGSLAGDLLTCLAEAITKMRGR